VVNKGGAEGGIVVYANGTRELRDRPTKPGLGPFGSRFLQIFAAAIEQAADRGVSRETIAAKLGVSLHTVHAWLKPSSANRTPFDRFFELACREDILPDAARAEMWERLGYEAGFVVFPEEQAEGGEGSPLVELAQVAAGFGRLADTMREAVSDNGEAQQKISPAEAKLIVDRLHELETDVARLRAVIDRNR
jgi:hypothetical protein